MAVLPEGPISDAELLSGAKKCLFDRSRLLTPEATLAAIQDLKQWVGQEIAFEEGASASFGRILSELWHAEYLDQLPPLLNRFERLASAYFVRRGSVTAFQGFCNPWRAGVLRRIIQFAEEGHDLDDLGHAPAPYALLAAGSLGRREQTLEDGDRYFLIWRDEEFAEYFESYAYRVLAILDQYGLICKEGAFLGKALWRGTVEKWDGYLAGQSHPGQYSVVETVADLRYVCGDEGIGLEAMRQATASLERNRSNHKLASLAQGIVELPVALGLFGEIRVEKKGEFAGCCNPEKYGLHPLICSVRLLAAQYGLDPGSTLERLAALGALGVLQVAQVELFAASYHVLAGLKVRREIALESPYFDPSSLPEQERESLKKALEAVRQLQRVVRCAFLGKRAARKNS